MGIINYIEFGGVKSSDYGIYVSGEGTFNAPERDVELIEIPGRNGEFSLDKGRFKNITVTYPVFNYETNLTDFRTRLRDFCNALKSKIGYQRLEDTFHPDEYRMATFVDMIDVKPVMYNTASTIELTFNCKPQRFLKSGEIPQTIGEWGETETVSGSIATFEAESNTGIKSLVVDIEPIQSGTGDPSPTNVRPISGWSGIDVGHSGKNLIDMDLPYTTASSGTTNHWAKEFTLPKAGSWIRCSGKCSDGTVLADVAIVWLNGNTQIWNIGANRGFQVPENIDEVTRVKLFTISAYAGKTVTEFQIEYVEGQSSTATAYEPYQGETITKSLGQTVYGGTLDVVSGKLTIDTIYVDLGGQWWAHEYANGRYRWSADTSAFAKREMGAILCCSQFAVNESPVTGSGVDNTITTYSNGSTYLNCFSKDSMSNEEFKQAMSGVIAIYKWNSSIEIQLTPTEVKSLLGDNNIWADSGEVSVEYGADPNDAYNPTLFESSPLLMARGYGDISFNNRTVTINNTVVGDTILLQPFSGTVSAYEDYGDGLINTGDTITVAQGSRVKYTLKFKNGIDLIGVIVGDLTGKPFTVTKTMDYSNRMVVLEAVFSRADFTAGTNKTVSSDFTVNIQYTENGLDQSTNMTLEPGIYYKSNTRTIDVYGLEGDTRPSIIQYVSIDVRCQQVTAYSTVSTLGDPTYIDLDIGEAYKVVNGEAVSLNNSVSIGSTLPTLAVGENTVTYPNTITSLEIVPRWWRV